MQILADLHDSITALGDVDLEQLGDDDLEDLAVGIQRQARRLAAVRADVFAAHESRQIFAIDGSKTAAAWLARRIGDNIVMTRNQFADARRLRHMDITREAFHAGDIGESHVRILCRLADSPRECVRECFVRDEEMLVEFAKTKTFDRFKQLVRYWELHADPDGAERDARQQYESRRLHMSKSFKGTWHLSGFFDAVQGEIIFKALDDIADELLRDEWSKAEDEEGDNPSVWDLGRTPAQRRADALEEMALRAQTAPADGQKPAPLFTVLLGEQKWADMCKLAATGTVIHPASVLRYFTAADLERSVWGLDGRCLDLSVQGPFRGAVRRALEVRDQECTYPGCTVPAYKCEADHIRPRSKGGETTQENGQMQCGKHNRHKSDKWPYLDDIDDPDDDP